MRSLLCFCTWACFLWSSSQSMASELGSEGDSRGGNISWLSPIDGDWENPLAWDLGRVPMVSDRVFLGLDDPYSVFLTSEASVQSLHIQNPGVELALDDHASLHLMSSLDNDGRILLLGGSVLAFEQHSVLSGIGILELGDGVDSGELTGQPGIEVVNADGHSIMGSGVLRLVLVNEGEVSVGGEGQHLQYQGDRLLNNGVIRVSKGASFSGRGSIVQGENGEFVIEGPGSVATFLVGGLQGGSLRTSNDGVARFSDIVVLRDCQIDDGSDVRIEAAEVAGTIANNAKISIEPASIMRVREDTLFQGIGELDLLEASSSILSFPDVILTQSAEHVIRGRGTIAASLLNEGLVRGDVTGEAMVLRDSTLMNDGTAEAVHGARLEFQRMEILQAASGVSQAIGEGSELILRDAMLRGGLIQSSEGGRISLIEPVLFDGVALNGILGILNQQVGLVNAITNNGTILVTRDDSASRVGISCGPNTQLAGTGELVLGGPLGNQIVVATDPSGGKLINGTQHTIRGRGEVAASLENFGVLRSDVPGGRLIITGQEGQTSDSNMNHGIVECVNGAHLVLDSITQSETGLIQAVGPESYIQVIGLIRYGRIETRDGARITIDGIAGMLDVYCNADIQVLRNGLLSFGPIKPNNHGVVDVNPDHSPEGADVEWGWAFGTIPLEGDGVIRLCAPGELSRIFANSTYPAEIGQDQRIEGIGLIDVDFISNGVISPGLDSDSSTGTLRVSGYLELTSQSRIEIDADTDENDLLVVDTQATLDGAVDFTISSQLAMQGPWTRTVLTSDSVLGRFSEVTSSGVPDHQRLRVLYETDRVIIGASCPSDFNLDGTLNFFDVSAFLTEFITGLGSADLNNDGKLDFFDISEFLVDFNNGC